jgi:NAD(P)-dependent dehydrogenase (short-subunit alcohol dehydrogenase family)
LAARIADGSRASHAVPEEGQKVGELEGKVAIITGGGSGIGKAIAAALCEEGCSVVIAGRNAERLGDAASEIEGTGSEVLAIPTDVTEQVQVGALFRQTIDRFGRLDILVNNAAAFESGRIDQVSLEAWNRVIGTNVTGAFLCTREAFRIMKDGGGGRIINIGSISAQRPRAHSAPYATSKHAIWGLTLSTALDGREFGITASCVHPGNVMVERRADGHARAGRDEGVETMISTDEIARTVLLMVTLPPDANMLEAIVLPVGQPYLGRG